MTDPAKRERAALDVLALLPDRWARTHARLVGTAVGGVATWQARIT